MKLSTLILILATAGMSVSCSGNFQESSTVSAEALSSQNGTNELIEESNREEQIIVTPVVEENTNNTNQTEIKPEPIEQVSEVKPIVIEQPVVIQQPEVKPEAVEQPVANPVNEVTVTAPKHPNCTGTINVDYVDEDGDGFGFQNGKTCLVVETPTNNENQATAANHPNCTGTINVDYVDEDGDGFGFQNGKTCIANGQQGPVETNNNAAMGELLFTANFAATTKQHSNTSRCVRQDPNNPTAINYDSLYYSGDFLINSNPWNAAITDYPYEQCILENANPGWTFDWGGEDDFMGFGKIWDVRSYPEVIYGVKRGDNNGSYGEYSHGNSVNETRAKTGLPVAVNQVPEIIIDLDYTASNTGDYNVSIESFFHSSCDNIVTQRPNSNMQYEIMLWLDIGKFNPAGGDGYVGDAVVDGLPVEVWTKDENNLHYLTFVVKESHRPVTKRQINWTKFIEFAKTEGHRITTSNEITNRPADSLGGYNRRVLQDNYCLANILIGTEIWNGKGDFQLNKYEIKQYKK